MVIEILSPSTARRDKNKKFLLYEKYGVREYWLVDPDAQYIEVWPLEDSKFAPKGFFGPDESFVSPVLVDKTIILSTVFSR